MSSDGSSSPASTSLIDDITDATVNKLLDNILDAGPSDLLETDNSGETESDNESSNFEQESTPEPVKDEDGPGLPAHAGSTSPKYQCDICKNSFISRSSLHRHQLSHTGERPHKCTHCDATFTRKENLQNHLLIHSGEKPFQCKRCDFRSRSSHNVTKHQRIHERGTVYRCSECEFSSMIKADILSHIVGTHATGKCYVCSLCLFGYSSKSKLATHMEKTHQEVNYCCDICGVRFSSNSSLRRHALSHTGVKPHKCSDCGKQFTRADSLRDHMKVHQLEGKDISCDLCDFKCGTKRTLNQHLISAHDQKKFRFKCSACDYSSDVRSTVAQHIANTHIDAEDNTSVLVLEEMVNHNPVEKCNICDKTFAHHNNLKRHMLIHTGKTYQCKECDRNFSRKDYLDEHTKLIHTKEHVLNCKQCDFITTSQTYLNKHVQRRHVDVKYTCSLCEYVGVLKDDLGVHMFEVHDVKRAFYCNHCSYGFAERVDLSSHTELKHPQVRIYICGECDEKFIRSSSYHRHVKTQHSTAQPYKCKFCSRAFNRSDKLAAHVKALHGTQQLDAQPSVSASAPHCSMEDSNEMDTSVVSTENVCDVKMEVDSATMSLWKCDACGEELTSQKELVSHYNARHSEETKQPTSDLVPKDVEPTESETTQIVHKPVTNDNTHRCTVCPKSFKKKYDLLRHMTRKHKCKGMNVQSNPRLKLNPSDVIATPTKSHQHKELATTKKTHTCKECGDVFSRNSALLRHERSRHSEVKPYKCDLCEKRFTRNEALTKHMQAHEEGKTKPHQCDICGHGFLQLSSLNKHKITHGEKSSSTGSDTEADVALVVDEIIDRILFDDLSDFINPTSISV